MRRASPPRCRSKASRRERGQGANKREAEQAAALAMLLREGVWQAPQRWLSPTRRTAQDTRCGFVALIGAPNSGKSTLTNALVGAKVSIVTHKAQTTRGPVRGIALIGTSQVILVDTPGIFQPKRRLDRAMFASAWDRAGDADIVVSGDRRAARARSDPRHRC